MCVCVRRQEATCLKSPAVSESRREGLFKEQNFHSCPCEFPVGQQRERERGGGRETKRTSQTSSHTYCITGTLLQVFRDATLRSEKATQKDIRLLFRIIQIHQRVDPPGAHTASIEGEVMNVYFQDSN